MHRIPAIVLLITGLHVAFLTTYSVTYPTWTGYDEAQHVDMVYGLLHGGGWPGPGDRMISKGVAATSDDFDRGRYADMFQSGGKRRGSPSFAEIAPTPRGERGSFDDLGGPAPVTDGRLSNQMVQHPPLVYAVGAVLLRAVPGSAGWAYDQQVYLLRLFNILLVAPLPILAWATARRLRLAEPIARGAAVLPLAVPGFDRVGATFNNDGILMLATGLLTFTLAGVLVGDRRKRTAGWAALWLALALLSKGLALALPVMVVAAYLVGWWRARSAGRDRPSAAPATVPSTVPSTTPVTVPSTGPSAGPAPRRGRIGALVGSLPWVPATIAVGGGLALGGWWWVRNYVRYGAVQPNGWGVDPPRREPLLLPDSFLTWFWYFVRTMTGRFWSGLGMFEPPQLAPVAVVLATVLVGVCGVAALVSWPCRRARTTSEDVDGTLAATGTGDVHGLAGHRPAGIDATATAAAAVAAAAVTARAVRPTVPAQTAAAPAGLARSVPAQAVPAQAVAEPGATADRTTATEPTTAPTARRRGDGWRGLATTAMTPAVLLAPVAFAYITVGQRSWAEYERYTRGIAVQGRYLYLGLVGLGVVVAAGLARVLGRRAHWTPALLLAGAVIMQALALLAVCTYYWLPRGVVFTPARIPDIAAAIARWAPFPVGVTWTILAGTALLALVVLATEFRHLARAAASVGRRPA